MADEPVKRVIGRPFKPGEGGRPKGARNKLGEAFLEALAADFQESGIEAIKVTRENDPTAYCKIVASLLPKEVTGADGGAIATEIVYRWASPDDQ